MLKNLCKFFSVVILAITGIVKIVGQAIIPIWKSHTSGNVWFAIFYQPLLVLFTLLLLLKPIKIAYDDSEIRIMMIIIIVFAALTLSFIENAIIELFYHLRKKSSDYDMLQELQKYFNNYALLIISLISLYFASFPSDSKTAILGLLIFGILFFVTTICSDTYRIFIYEKGSVKKLAVRIQETWEND